MNGSPEELRSWMHRAESFVRQLNYLPGEWGISVSIEPPITSDEADRLAATLPLGLPAPLRMLYLEGAAKFKCRYHWTPREDMLRRTGRIFPHQRSFYGGPSFIPWSELPDVHGIHSWWDGWDDPSTEDQRKAREIWRQTVPFIAVGNGDAVGLHVTGESDIYPVVYLCHDDEECPVTPLSPSFDQFLTEWEKICYVGPEIWLLDSFWDHGKPLSGEGNKARKWREILSPPATTENRSRPPRATRRKSKD
jgi:hypothetical protein